MAFVDGKKVPLPINLTTVNAVLDKDFSEEELKDYFESVRLKLGHIRNAKDMITSQVGDFFYEKFFKQYSFKQWGVFPEKLEPEVTKRLPLRYDSDDRYFTDKYQGLPVNGYAELFKKLLSNRNITVLPGMDYRKVIDDVKFDRLIYTGPIDYYFDYKYGNLSYRSLRFECENSNMEYYQEVGVVNYPNDYEFTRITEFKHMTLQKHSRTTIMREYPTNVGEPYYPIPMENAVNLYGRYKIDADKLKSVYFAGRLAEYKYYNMDQAVKRALEVFNVIASP